MPDRILGPLTMVQFIYAVIGFGASYAIFNTIPSPFSYLLIVPIALFVACLDFVKVNERPFLDFFISAIEYAMSPKKRLWLQDSDAGLSIEITKSVNVIAKKNRKEVGTEQITQFAQKTDSANQLLIKR
jgi:hypothetical protein